MVDSLPHEELNRRVIMPAEAVIPQPVLPLSIIVGAQHLMSPPSAAGTGLRLDTI
jgi:hypothetical protein